MAIWLIKTFLINCYSYSLINEMLFLCLLPSSKFLKKSTWQYYIVLWSWTVQTQVGYLSNVTHVDTSIYVDLARMTATIHVQCIFKNILSLGINVLKKKRNKGILIDGGFSKILIPGPERRDLLTF